MGRGEAKAPAKLLTTKHVAEKRKTSDTENETTREPERDETQAQTQAGQSSAPYFAPPAYAKTQALATKVAPPPKGHFVRPPPVGTGRGRGLAAPLVSHEVHIEKTKPPLVTISWWYRFYQTMATPPQEDYDLEWSLGYARSKHAEILFSEVEVCTTSSRDKRIEGAPYSFVVSPSGFLLPKNVRAAMARTTLVVDAQRSTLSDPCLEVFVDNERVAFHII